MQTGGRALKVTKDILDEVKIGRGRGTLLEVKPYRESDRGIPDAREMYRAFHNRRDWNGINTSPTNSFEIWFDGESVRFFMYIEQEKDVRRAIRHIAANFPGARITIPKEASGHTIPELREDEYVVGTRFKLAKHFFEPVSSPDGINWESDPYRNILPELVDDNDVREVIQVLFRPAGTGWTSSYFNDAAEYAENLSSRSQSAQLSSDEASGPGELGRYGSLIKSQINQPGYYVNLRVLTISQNKQAALEQADDIAKSYNQYYREFDGQTFVPLPMRGSRIREMLIQTVGREGKNMDWPQSPLTLWKRNRRGYCETAIMTIPELTGLAHFPDGDTLNTSAIDWEKLDTTNRMPTKAPRYEDYKEYDTTPETGDSDVPQKPEPEFDVDEEKPALESNDEADES